MNQSYTQIETELIVTRDNKLDPSFKRKQAAKHVKHALSLTARVGLDLTAELAQFTANKLNEVSRPVRLDLFDYMYGTNLRSQYFSGLRTQKILKAKREHGLA